MVVATVLTEGPALSERILLRDLPEAQVCGGLSGSWTNADHLVSDHHPMRVRIVFVSRPAMMIKHTRITLLLGGIEDGSAIAPSLLPHISSPSLRRTGARSGLCDARPGAATWAALRRRARCVRQAVRGAEAGE